MEKRPDQRVLHPHQQHPGPRGNQCTEDQVKAQGMLDAFRIPPAVKLRPENPRASHGPENAQVHYEQHLVYNGDAGHLLRADLSHHQVVQQVHKGGDGVLQQQRQGQHRHRLVEGLVSDQLFHTFSLPSPKDNAWAGARPPPGNRRPGAAWPGQPIFNCPRLLSRSALGQGHAAHNQHRPNRSHGGNRFSQQQEGQGHGDKRYGKDVGIGTDDTQPRHRPGPGGIAQAAAHHAQQRQAPRPLPGQQERQVGGALRQQQRQAGHQAVKDHLPGHQQAPPGLQGPGLP